LDLCDENTIRVDWVSVTHPRTNGQVECASGLILQGLKPRILTQEGEHVHARLITRARKWAAKVPSVLWRLRTMPNRSTNFTPFLWYTTRRSCCPPNYRTGPQGSSPTNRLRLSKHGRISSTCSKNQGTSLPQGHPATSKHSRLEGSPLGLPCK
jgi:hypothetical protein